MIDKKRQNCSFLATCETKVTSYHLGLLIALYLITNLCYSTAEAIEYNISKTNYSLDRILNQTKPKFYVNSFTK